MNFRNLFTLMILILLAGCSENSQRPGARFSPWMNHSEYQEYFDTKCTTTYPVLVEGGIIKGEASYRAIFVPYPSMNFSFWSHHGLSQGQFEDRDDELRSKGYILITRQEFTDEDGAKRIQATWIRK